MRAFTLLLLLATVPWVPANVLGQDDTRPGVAVMPLTNGGSYGADAEDLEGLKVGLQALLLNELKQNSNLRIVERARLNEIINELQLDTLVDARTAARVGKLVGARYMVLGTFVDLSGLGPEQEFHVTAEVVDVETSEILEAKRASDKREKMYPILVDLATQLTEAIDLPPLPADVQQSRSEREIPPEGVFLYSQAMRAADRGDHDRAVQLYQRLVSDFPQWTEVKEELRQLEET